MLMGFSIWKLKNGVILIWFWFVEISEKENNVLREFQGYHVVICDGPFSIG